MNLNLNLKCSQMGRDVAVLWQLQGLCRGHTFA